MNKRQSKQQWGWEPLVSNSEWDAVVDWWQNWYFANPDVPQPLLALLVELRKKVPKIRVKNGIELIERHIHSYEDSSEWHGGNEHLRGAAQILDAGELEAAVEGEPETALQKWRAHQSLIRERLQEFIEGPEVTEGAKELSRKSHAKKAIGMLQDIGDASDFMGKQMNTAHDRNWLRENIAEVVLLAFDAGRHVQAAWGKEFERLAAVRQNQTTTLNENNEGRNLANAERHKEASKWRQHAGQVEAEHPSKLRNKTDRARSILRNWHNVGDPRNAP